MANFKEKATAALIAAGMIGSVNAGVQDAEELMNQYEEELDEKGIVHVLKEDELVDYDEIINNVLDGDEGSGIPGLTGADQLVEDLEEEEEILEEEVEVLGDPPDLEDIDETINALIDEEEVDPVPSLVENVVEPLVEVEDEVDQIVAPVVDEEIDDTTIL